MFWKELVRQMYDIGIGSLLIVALICIFIGAVTAIQFNYQLDGTLVPKYYIGYIVRDITLIEMAPTVTCLVLAGKVGSNMASELGGMRQKEHIDAMDIMGVNTYNFLIGLGFRWNFSYSDVGYSGCCNQYIGWILGKCTYRDAFSGSIHTRIEFIFHSFQCNINVD
jgi:hypothetical protein